MDGPVAKRSLWFAVPTAIGLRLCGSKRERAMADANPSPARRPASCTLCLRARSSPTVLGSTADYSMRGAHCTSVVVKGRGADFPKSGPFVVACDGSRKSLFCIRQVLVSVAERPQRTPAAVLPLQLRGPLDWLRLSCARPPLVEGNPCLARRS